MRHVVSLSWTIALLVPVASAQQQAQPNAMIFSTSYQPDWPVQVNIAPGQVLPLAVHGLELHLDKDVKAEGYIRFPRNSLEFRSGMAC